MGIQAFGLWAGKSGQKGGSGARQSYRDAGICALAHRTARGFGLDFHCYVASAHSLVGFALYALVVSSM
jgi:hypothetical protein